MVRTALRARFSDHDGCPKSPEKLWLLSPSNGCSRQISSLYPHLLCKQLSNIFGQEGDEGFLELISKYYLKSINIKTDIIFLLNIIYCSLTALFMMT